LDIDVLSDGSALAPGNPRLKVEVHPEVYEGNMVWSAILFLAMGVLAFVGTIFLIVSYIRNRRLKLPNANSDKRGHRKSGCQYLPSQLKAKSSGGSIVDCTQGSRPREL